MNLSNNYELPFPAFVKASPCLPKRAPLPTSIVVSFVVGVLSVNAYAGGFAPSFITHPQSQEIVVGSDATFFVDVTGDEPFSFQWRKDSVEIPGATDSSYSILDVILGDSGDYDVIATNPFGSSISNSALLTVIVGDAPSFITHPQSQEIVVGSDATFFVDVTGAEPFSFQWRKDSVEIPGANEPSFSIANVSFADSGNYDVIATNPFGESTSDPASLTIVPEPSSSVILGTFLVCLLARVWRHRPTQVLN